MKSGMQMFVITGGPFSEVFKKILSFWSFHAAANTDMFRLFSDDRFLPGCAVGSTVALKHKGCGT